MVRKMRPNLFLPTFFHLVALLIIVPVRMLRHFKI
jgi:hypothetical protein